MTTTTTADHRALTTLPLVVLPASGRFLSPVALATGPAIAVHEAAAALGAARTALTGGGDGSAGELLAVAATRLRAVATALAGDLVDPGPYEADRSDLHDVYMGVRRAPLTGAACLAERVLVAARALDDLDAARVDVNDMTAEIDGMALLLPAAAESAPGTTARPDRGARRRIEHRLGGAALERWVAIHHLYAVVLLALTDRLDDTVHLLERGQPDLAAAPLHDAGTLVRAGTAAMVHAAAMSMDHYLGAVRPTMQPPRAPVPLGGSMNADNTTARAAVERFLDRLDQPYEQLARDHPRLAEARSRFLTYDLLDAERHINVAAGLIGDDTSLLQHPDGATNAVGYLRLMRHRRAARYAELMRFGDRSHRRRR